jgi:putative heme iron utilization protein
VDREGVPVTFFSAIAQHTRNLQANPKVSLTVVEHAQDGNVRAAVRVTYSADARFSLFEEIGMSLRSVYRGGL